MDDIKQLEDIFSFEPSTSAIDKRTAKEFSTAVTVAETAIKTVEIRTLEDKEFLVDSIKTMIEAGHSVIKTMKEEIKIGTDARRIEVFSYVMDSLTNSIGKLIELNKTLFDISTMQDPIVPPEPPPSQNIQNNLFMDPNQLMDFLAGVRLKAMENSKLNDVKLDFNNSDDVK